MASTGESLTRGLGIPRPDGRRILPPSLDPAAPATPPDSQPPAHFRPGGSLKEPIQLPTGKGRGTGSSPSRGARAVVTIGALAAGFEAGAALGNSIQYAAGNPQNQWEIHVPGTNLPGDYWKPAPNKVAVNGHIGDPIPVSVEKNLGLNGWTLERNAQADIRVAQWENGQIKAPKNTDGTANISTVLDNRGGATIHGRALGVYVYDKGQERMYVLALGTVAQNGTLQTTTYIKVPPEGLAAYLEISQTNDASGAYREFGDNQKNYFPGLRLSNQDLANMINKTSDSDMEAALGNKNIAAWDASSPNQLNMTLKAGQDIKLALPDSAQSPSDSQDVQRNSISDNEANLNSTLGGALSVLDKSTDAKSDYSHLNPNVTPFIHFPGQKYESSDPTNGIPTASSETNTSNVATVNPNTYNGGGFLPGFNQTSSDHGVKIVWVY